MLTGTIRGAALDLSSFTLPAVVQGRRRTGIEPPQSRVRVGNSRSSRCDAALRRSGRGVHSYNMSDDGRTPADPRGRSTPSRLRVLSEDDHALIHRMAEGDESALAALYDRWGPRVHTVAFWILQDADEAEDVVEETFWQAWRSAANYDGRRAAGSTWLMMIARSRALDRLRRQRRRAGWLAAPSTLNALLDGPGLAGRDLPGAQAGIELYTELTAALAALPPEQREVVEMAFFGGLSHAEISVQTAQPLGTVKTRIRLAMQKLRQRLAFLREEGS